MVVILPARTLVLDCGGEETHAATHEAGVRHWGADGIDLLLLREQALPPGLCGGQCQVNGSKPDTTPLEGGRNLF